MIQGLMRGALLHNNGLIATDTAQAYELDFLIDDNRYYLNSTLHQNPTQKNTILHCFTDGTAHVTDAGKKIVFRKSTDKGVSWAAKTTLYDPTDGTFQVQDPGIGYDRHGRLHILADCHTNFANSGETHEARYMYSDDDGATVSTPVVLTLPSNGLATFRFYGKIIDVGGTLLAPCYFLTEEGNTTNSARYCLRCENPSDSSPTWTFVLIESTSEYINETEFLAINDNVIVAMSRDETTKQFMMYKSTDRGLTWARVGVFSTSVSLTVAAPCRLHKFRLDNGTWVAAMYFTQKAGTTKTLYAIYGRLDVGIEAGIGLFKPSTLTTIATNTFIIHYGDVCHFNGNMNAIGIWCRESNFPTDNELIYITCPATQYSTVFNLINPSTIYDRLAYPAFIGSYRGMVSNSDNAYGVVNGSNQVTTLKSIAPGPTGLNFTATAGGIILGDGLEYDGSKVLTGASLTAFDFMHTSSAGYADINYTITAVIRAGNSSDPNAGLSIIGNSGASAGSRGHALIYDDRAAVSRNNALLFTISKGTAGFTVEFVNQNILTPNVDHVVQIEVDLSQAVQNNKVKVWIDKVLQSTTVTAFTTTITSGNATYNMQIGGAGNNLLPFVGSIKDIVIQNAIDLASVRENFADALMELESIA